MTTREGERNGGNLEENNRRSNLEVHSKVNPSSPKDRAFEINMIGNRECCITLKSAYLNDNMQYLPVHLVDVLG